MVEVDDGRKRWTRWNEDYRRATYERLLSARDLEYNAVGILLSISVSCVRFPLVSIHAVPICRDALASISLLRTIVLPVQPAEPKQPEEVLPSILRPCCWCYHKHDLVGCMRK